MTKCWKFLPENRPSFTELHDCTSNYLERVAGYLEVNFNPFDSMESDTYITTEVGKQQEEKLMSGTYFGARNPSLRKS